ncbi:M50 family metallopeptidase [Edaphobacter bradus]|uniref:M50 family metallopeptidase n=1 Tax=Edaphobacter bradus TaxID=2259016 RepID=UPI0021E0F127|nr:M50 family metallopeptidase [Edaphobacter bradus]
MNVLFGCMMFYFAGRAFWQGTVLQLTLGVAGLVVFSPRNLTARLAQKTPVLPPIPGDGTNALLDKMIWIFGLAGYLAAAKWWVRWAHSEGLARSYRPGSYLELLLALLVVTLVHELGHTIVGKALGMKLRGFVVGPFDWHIREGKWEFRFLPAKIFALDGATGVVPTTLEHFRSHQLCMIAAGPAASLIGGLLALGAALTAPGNSWEPAWHFLARIATLSLLASILNLIPFRAKNSYSDGAQIYQLLSKGPWGDYHRALSIVASTLVTPLRPRDYDIEAIQRAAACIAQGQRGLLLRLHASSYYLDRGQITEATQSLAEAEAIYRDSAQNISAELHTAFVFRTAFLRRDAAAARLWWQRMEAKNPTRFNVDYWLARSALCWVEHHLDEAQEAWHKAFALAQQLPKAGAYEYDRYRATLLWRALDQSLSARLTQDQPTTTR